MIRRRSTGGPKKFFSCSTMLGNPIGHVPLTRRQFDDMLKMVKPGLGRIILRSPDHNRLAGFGISLPDQSPHPQIYGHLNSGKLRLFIGLTPACKIRALACGSPTLSGASLATFCAAIFTWLNILPVKWLTIPGPGQSQALDQGSIVLGSPAL
jgi:hypothetical protein